MRAKLLEIGDCRPTGSKEGKGRREREDNHLTEVVGGNLLFARNLNQLKVIDAQKLLRYASPGSISKIEAGTSKVSRKGKLAVARKPPSLLDAIYFAKAYGVSLDFLVGLSPYPEPESKERAMAEVQMQTSATIRRFITEATEAILYSTATGIDYKVRLDGYMLVMSKMLTVLARFIELNKVGECWDDMKLGLSLENEAVAAIHAHNRMTHDIEADRNAKQQVADEKARQAGNRYPILDEVL